MPSDQTEMSLLPALMQIPGEIKELHFLAFWRTWGKAGRSPWGRKLRGGDGRELGLATEDLWLYFD